MNLLFPYSKSWRQRRRKLVHGRISFCLLGCFRIDFFDNNMARRISLALLWVSAGIIVGRSHIYWYVWLILLLRQVVSYICKVYGWSLPLRFEFSPEELGIIDDVSDRRRVFCLWRLFHSVAVGSSVFLFPMMNSCDFGVKTLCVLVLKTGCRNSDEQSWSCWSDYVTYICCGDIYIMNPIYFHYTILVLLQKINMIM